jgi:hypothetical protein
LLFIKKENKGNIKKRIIMCCWKMEEEKYKR